MSQDQGYNDMLEELRAKATMPDESMILSGDNNGTARVRSNKHGSAIVIPTAAERRALEAQVAKQEAAQQVEEPRKRGRRPKAQAVVDPVPSYVKVIITENGNINIPTQYKHVYNGEGVLILGLVNDFSYIPRNATKADSGLLENVVTLNTVSGKFIYVGNSFVDDSGTTNLILINIGE